eukprot:54177-Eustigmatos_ZCMA.PRE.1
MKLGRLGAMALVMLMMCIELLCISEKGTSLTSLPTCLKVLMFVAVHRSSRAASRMALCVRSVPINHMGDPGSR